MKTIKERAEESLSKWDSNVYFHYSDMTEDSYKNGYIEGAAEQEIIDAEKRQRYIETVLDVVKFSIIEKACEWLESYMESLDYIDEWCRNGEVDFRKAMEE